MKKTDPWTSLQKVVDEILRARLRGCRDAGSLRQPCKYSSKPQAQNLKPYRPQTLTSPTLPASKSCCFCNLLDSATKTSGKAENLGSGYSRGNFAQLHQTGVDVCTNVKSHFVALRDATCETAWLATCDYSTCDATSYVKMNKVSHLWPAKLVLKAGVPNPDTLFP